MSVMAPKIERPDENEYAPFYAGYIQCVPKGDIFEILARQSSTLRSLLLATFPARQLDFRPGPNEWSVREVVGHINDVERVFAYRALCISRGDQTPLPGFEQDDYVRAAHFDERTVYDLIEEFDLLRRANLMAFKHLNPEASKQRGTASGAPVSVRALLYMMAGHVEHHIQSLRQDYLAKL